MDAEPGRTPVPPGGARPFWRLALVAVAGWTAVGLVAGLSRSAAATLAGNPGLWSASLQRALGSVWLWALFTPLVVWSGARWPVMGRSSRVRHYLWHVALLLGLNTVEALILAGLWSPLAHPFATRFFGALTPSLVSYAVLAAVGNAVLLKRQLWEEERRNADLSAQLATAQLSALKAQLHPHFFFNTLNAIAELVHRDADAADRMVTRLGAFLRRSLDASERQEIPLEEELDALDAYLDVLRLRFGDRLTVRLNVDPEALSTRVPPLLLQPLVENALKHGLEPREGAGVLEVTGWLEDGVLRLEVRDDGVGLTAGERHEGIGLRNVRGRLHRLYGDDAGLALSAAPGSGAVASVWLPVRPRVAPGAPAPGRVTAATTGEFPW